MDPSFGVSPVHRLDKETSGVILLAVTREVFRFFSKQFESRQVTKRYVAVLHGRLENPNENDPWGTWSWALAKTAGGRHNPEGAGHRQDSRTRYRSLTIVPITRWWKSSFFPVARIKSGAMRNCLAIR